MEFTTIIMSTSTFIVGMLIENFRQKANMSEKYLTKAECAAKSHDCAQKFADQALLNQQRTITLTKLETKMDQVLDAIEELKDNIKEN